MIGFSMIAPFLIKYLVSEIAKSGERTDWNAVKSRFDAWVRGLIPGDGGAIENVAVRLVNDIIDVAHNASLDSGTLVSVLSAAANKDWSMAEHELKQVLVDGTENSYLKGLIAAI